MFKPTLLMIALFATTAAQAGVIDLTSMSGGANIYTLGNFTSYSSDVEGALVSGGSVKIESYAVNQNNRDAFGAPGYALVARNDVTLKNGSINNGLVYAGGTVSLTSAGPAPASQAKPLDFDAVSAYYQSLSANLSQVAPTGTVTSLYSGVKVSGGGQGSIDLFNVASNVFANSSSWTLHGLTPGQTLIFNVSGASVTFNNGGISFAPLNDYNVLFNFYEATSLDVRGIIGSVLAPNAAVTANWGQVNGNLIVDSWSSTVQINANHYFKPTELAGFDVPGANAAPAEVPEPASAALMLVGLGLLVRQTVRQTLRQARN